MKNRDWNITEKCEWGENGEKKICTGRCCFTCKQDCATERATRNLQSQPFIWNSLNKQTNKQKREISTASMQIKLTVAFTQLYMHPSTHPHTEGTGTPRGLLPRPRVFMDWHATLRASKAHAAAVLNLGGLGSGLLQASGTGSTRPMQQPAHGSTQLAPHLLVFASRTWNLFSNIISSQCPICRPWQCICSHSYLPATPQNNKHQSGRFEALFKPTSRFALTITFKPETHSSHQHLYITLPKLLQVHRRCYFKARRISFLTVSAEQLSTSYLLLRIHYREHSNRCSVLLTGSRAKPPPNHRYENWRDFKVDSIS